MPCPAAEAAATSLAEAVGSHTATTAGQAGVLVDSSARTAESLGNCEEKGGTCEGGTEV